MLFIWKRKHVTLIAIGLFAALVGYINWQYAGKVSAPNVEYNELAERQEEEMLGSAELVNAKVGEDDYFRKARMDREEGHSKAIETLNTVIQNDATDEESRTAAAEQVAAIAQNSDTEIKVENLIKAKGYQDAVVYMSDDSVSVVIKSEGLEASDISLIQGIVTQETGAAAEQIKIVEIN